MGTKVHDAMVHRMDQEFLDWEPIDDSTWYGYGGLRTFPNNVRPMMAKITVDGIEAIAFADYEGVHVEIYTEEKSTGYSTTRGSVALSLFTPCTVDDLRHAGLDMDCEEIHPQSVRPQSVGNYPDHKWTCPICGDLCDSEVLAVLHCGGAGSSHFAQWYQDWGRHSVELKSLDLSL